MPAEPRRIESRHNPFIVGLRRLAADPGAYRRSGQLWIEGEHLCGACVARGLPVTTAVLSDTGSSQPALRRHAEVAEAIVIVPDALMQGLSTLESPPAIAFVLPWAGPGDLRPGAATVVLDRLQDAGNVGAVLRSAAAFGFGQVAALKGTAALWSPKVLRAGMGAHFGLNLVESLDEAALEALGVPLLGTQPRAPQAIGDVPLPWPCAWVLGHEGQGVSSTLAARCALNLRIPQPGGEESLNVAAAAAVCLYESTRQRAAAVENGASTRT